MLIFLSSITFTHDISSLDFGISEEDKKKLYQSGIDAALDFFG